MQYLLICLHDEWRRGRVHSLMESIVREEHEHEIATEEQQEEEGKIAFIPASATNFSQILLLHHCLPEQDEHIVMLEIQDIPANGVVELIHDGSLRTHHMVKHAKRLCEKSLHHRSHHNTLA